MNTHTQIIAVVTVTVLVKKMSRIRVYPDGPVSDASPREAATSEKSAGYGAWKATYKSPPAPACLAAASSP